MATSAFKSATKRTSIGSSDDYSSSSSTRTPSSAHRRSRSLSRFSRPLPAASTSDDYPDEEAPPSRGRFVNKVRGSGFPELSLDDLADRTFGSADRGRASASRSDSFSSSEKSSVSQRRGRSVSRHGGRFGEWKGSGGNNLAGGRVNLESVNSRRRRSVSVVRYRVSDSESDLDHSQNTSNHASSKSFTGGNNQSSKASASNHRQGLGRSLSQKDLQYHDDYSSQSSALTDEEGRDSHSNKNGIERTIRAVYAQKTQHPTCDDMNSGLYEAMRKELRHAIEEIRMEIEQAMSKTNSSVSESDDCLQSRNSDVIHAVSNIRRNYATKLEQSEKRKQDLLAEIVLEERHGRELSKTLQELLPDPKNVVQKPLRTRKRSNDRSRMSKRLTEEAEKYIEDFIFNVEDSTDISSLDGERSDTSSSLGGIIKAETFQSPAIVKPIHVESDGIMLPWLQWETSHDASSPLSCKNKEPTATPKTNLWPPQEATPGQDSSNPSASRESWSPGDMDGHSTNVHSGSRTGEFESYPSRFSLDETRKPRFDVDEYLKRPSEEDSLLEKWRLQQRIHSGSLLLCNKMLF